MAFNRNAAKAAGYSDQEIDQYLASKGTTATPTPQVSSMMPTPTVQEQPQQEGFISKLIRPTVDAFKGTARNIATAGQVAGSALLSPFAPQAAANLASKSGGLVLTQDELKELEENPDEALKKQAKRSAIIMSYAVPVGKSANIFGRTVGTSAFKGGAIAGGLYGAGQEEATPESIVTSALLGGATAWATDKIFSGLAKKGGKMEQKAIGVRPKNLKEAVKGQDLVTRAKEMGLPAGSADKQLDWTMRTYSQLTEKLDDAVNRIDDTFDGTKLASDAIDRAKGVADVSTGSGASAAKKWGDMLADVTSAKDLAKLKFQMQQILGGKAPKTDGQFVTLAFHNAVDDALKGSSKEVGNILADMTTLHAIAGTPSTGGLIRQAMPLPPTQDVSVLGIRGVPLPGSRGAMQTGQSLLGRGMSTLGQAGQQIPPSAGARAPQILQAMGVNLGQSMPERTEPVTGFDDYNNLINEVSNRKANVKVDDGSPQITKAQMMQVLMSPEIKSTTKSSIMQAYKLQSGGLDATEKRKVAEAQDALNLLDIIESNYTELYNAGLTAKKPGLLERVSGGVKGKSAALTGDPAALAYENTKKAFVRKLARAAGEKGVLTDPDVQDFANALPSFDTNPEAALRQLQYLRQVIEGNINDFIQYQEEDYDTNFQF